MNRTNGRIAEQSKQSFADALVKLMETYNFKEITVTQLSQEACLSRRTFYRLFEGRDDVLDVLFQRMYGEFAESIRDRDVRSYWTLVQGYFDFWEGRKDMLLLFEKNGLLPRLFDYVYRNAAAVFRLVRSDRAASEYEYTLPYLLAYSVGGMHSMLIKWVSLGMTVPSSELVAILKNGFASPEL